MSFRAEKSDSRRVLAGWQKSRCAEEQSPIANLANPQGYHNLKKKKKKRLTNTTVKQKFVTLIVVFIRIAPKSRVLYFKAERKAGCDS